MTMSERLSEESPGLTTADAVARFAAEGPNELAHGGRRRIWQIAFEVISEPMLLMLLAAGAIYIGLGDLGEALLIVVLASASVVITIVQETRSERVLDALRDLTSPRALVIRDGEQKRVPAARSFAATSSCSTRAIVYPPMRRSSLAETSKPTSRY
jgi:P-type Ca2+ transporter type 2C